MIELIRRNQYIEKVLNYLGKGLIVVLTGQRRVGKSCILQSVSKEIKVSESEANIIYINKEYAEFRNILTDVQLNEYIDSHLKDNVPNYLFIDEVQEIDGFENSLRNYQAKQMCDIVITGSNAKMLSGELATYLSGRYIEIHIQSLDYDEFLKFHKKADEQNALIDYLSYGGLPQLAHIGLNNRQMTMDYLGDVYNTVIMKDVIMRESIRNVRFLTDIVSFLSDNIGKNISANSISKFMRSQGQTISPMLISNYIGFLTNAYIIDEVKRYDIHGRKIFETNEKYYFEDIGLRNRLIGINIRRDIEKLMENAVYLHLKKKGYKIYVGQLQNGEIDFVAEQDGQRIYIQVSYMLQTDETMEREFGNLLKIKDNYPKIVVCMDDLATQGSYEGIDCVHLKEFLKR
ncbi:MAG: ATP-binding protein [Marinilabiliaceae bacterium]|nr:ATP-binding protein [Bacteroidales bacterium]MDD5816324.1 ATP-binding protein [Bacteroidales bacterium]